MEEKLQHLYEVQLPLEGSSLKELSAYVIVGKDRNCIIDVGFADKACDEAIRSAVAELGIKTQDTDILLTHSHRDHCGNLQNLYGDFGTIYCSAWDAAEISQSLNPYESIKDCFNKCGIPDFIWHQMPSNLGTDNYIPKSCIGVISEGTMLNYGEYHLSVLDLKGHMPGQIGFYDSSLGILFPGDHVLNKITPNIGFYSEEAHSLDNYLKGLNRVRNLSVSHVFPAHRGEVHNLAERVDEIIEHHNERLDEIMGVLCTKPMCAYEVASKVKWYYRKGNFALYPAVMVWMASSEILSHLQYLYEQGELLRSGSSSETYIYKCKN